MSEKNKKIPKIRFKDKNWNDFPEWREVKLGEVCEIKKGTQLSSENFVFWEYLVINWWISESWYHNEFNTKKNTITISEWWNSCWFVNFIKTDFWAWWHCYTLESLKINKLYFYQLLKNNENSIMSLRVGSWLPNIQKKDLEKFNLYISNNIEEQEKIANFLNAIDESIELKERELEKLKEYKKWIMQQIFTKSKTAGGGKIAKLLDLEIKIEIIFLNGGKWC